MHQAEGRGTLKARDDKIMNLMDELASNSSQLAELKQQVRIMAVKDWAAAISASRAAYSSSCISAVAGWSAPQVAHSCIAQPAGGKHDAPCMGHLVDDTYSVVHYHVCCCRLMRLLRLLLSWRSCAS